MDATQVTREIVEMFQQLSTIPHPSGQEQALATHLAALLRSWGGTVAHDTHWNLRWDVPATAGLESAPLVCIQGHLDMVCVATPDSDFSPEQDGIRCGVQDGWLESDGRSSLGADNLLATTAALWLLKQPFPHGPVRVLLTTEEEQSLKGALAMDARWLDDVPFLINTDGFLPDQLIVGSGGGCHQIWTRNLETTPSQEPAWRLDLTGFPGGHSAADVGKGRVNPLRLLATLLMESDVKIASFSGGSAMNAIPTQASAVLVHKDIAAFQKRLSLVEELGGKWTLTPVSTPVSLWSAIDQQAALDFFLSLPSGVTAWLPEQPDTPACSNNLGLVSWDGTTLTYHVFLRGSPQQTLDRAANGCALLADRCGFELEQAAHFPPWEGHLDNPLALRMSRLWQMRQGTPMQRYITHVGLEPSAFLAQRPDLIAVVTGITVQNAHSIQERAKVTDLPAFVQLLQDTLQSIAQEDGRKDPV